MNERIKALAEQAGFIFWKDESWGPGPDNIDWSCDYQIEFNTFVQSLIKECVGIVDELVNRRNDGTWTSNELYTDHNGALFEVKRQIKERFGVKE
jgi:hypothetical protein